MDQVARVVRPNGLVSFSEWDFRVYDAHKNVLTGSETDSVPSHVARFCFAVNNAARARGGSVDAANRLTQWCTANAAYDPESVRHTDYWLPASPWCTDVGPEGDRLRAWGEAMRENSLVSEERSSILLKSQENLSDFYSRCSPATPGRRTYPGAGR